MEKELLTVAEAAVYLSASKNTINNKIKNREIPYIDLKGIGYRFRKKDLDDWLDVSSQTPLPLSANSPDKNFLLDWSVGHATVPVKGESSELVKISETRWYCGIGYIYMRETSQGIERYYVDYHDFEGERQQHVIKHAQTPMEAYKALKAEVREMCAIAYGEKAVKKKVRFKDFADEYLEDYAKVKKRSWRTDKSYLNANLIPYFGKYYLNQITPHLIEKYQGKRLKDGAKKSTVNRELACMKKLFNKAIDWDYETVNPVLKVDFFSEVDNLKERVLSMEEEKKLLAACPERLKPIVITALQTGMRRREILLMRWENVKLNLDVGYIQVPKEVSKSRKDRVITFNGMLKVELMKLKKCNDKSPYVFVNANTGKPFTDIKKAFKGACERAGIEGLRFHDLRHTYATRLAEMNVPLPTIKELLGHFKVSMTERYTHSSDESKRKAVKLLHQCYTEYQNVSN